jgi:hypothetical protein
MIDPLRLAALALEFGAARYGRGERRSTASLVLVIVGVVSAGAGGGFAVAAFLIYLLPILGPAGAALVVSGTLIAGAAVALVASDQLSRRSREPQVRPPDLQSLAAGAEDFVRDNKSLALSAALVAGLLIADQGSKPKED